MKFLQAVLYAIAATLAPLAIADAREAEVAVVYRELSSELTARAGASVASYLGKVDPDWAPTAERLLAKPTPPRARKVLRRLSDRKQQFVRLSGEPAWQRAHRQAQVLVQMMG